MRVEERHEALTIVVVVIIVLSAEGGTSAIVTRVIRVTRICVEAGKLVTSNVPPLMEPHPS